MSFDLQKLSLRSQNGAGLKNEWDYESAADDRATIAGAGYFAGMEDRLAVGDIINVTDSAGVKSRHIVNDITAGAVDITDGVVLDATDT
jgi:Ethanolamine utilization protein EutJ (predicted chaperonin)